MTDTAAREKLNELIAPYLEIRKRGFLIQDILSAFPHLGAPTEAPGHTDLMVTPESLDAYLEANPPPGAPTEDVVEAARAMVGDWCHSGLTGSANFARIAGDQIAAALTAHAARVVAKLAPYMREGGADYFLDCIERAGLTIIPAVADEQEIERVREAIAVASINNAGGFWKELARAAAAAVREHKGEPDAGRDFVAVPRNLLQAAVAVFAPTNPIVPEHRVVRELRQYAGGKP